MYVSVTGTSSRPACAGAASGAESTEGNRSERAMPYCARARSSPAPPPAGRDCSPSDRRISSCNLGSPVKKSRQPMSAANVGAAGAASPVVVGVEAEADRWRGRRSGRRDSGRRSRRRQRPLHGHFGLRLRQPRLQHTATAQGDDQLSPFPQRMPQAHAYHPPGGLHPPAVPSCAIAGCFPRATGSARPVTKKTGTKRIASTVAESMPPSTACRSRLAARSRARADRERQHAEYERERGHEDRAQPLAAGRIAASSRPSVLAGPWRTRRSGSRSWPRGRCREQSHLEIDVVRQAAQQRARTAPSTPSGTTSSTVDRHRPALVQRGETQEHHQQREGVERRGLRPGQPLLVGKPRPLEAEAGGQLLAQPSISAMASPELCPAPVRPGFRRPATPL